MRVTDTIDTQTAAPDAHPAPDTAGARLRAAREAAGLSVDDVAQQLKLAPRQVIALEEDDFERLPGRTFVRGFARNYARFLQLDADALLARLPASESAPALERPSFAAARRPMGEIPVERVATPSATRRLLPLLLVVVIAAAGYYEYTRLVQRRDATDTLAGATPASVVPQGAATTASPASVVPQGGTTTAPVPAAPTTTVAGTTTTTLPNPVAAAPAAPAGSRDAATAAGAAPSGGTVPAPAGGAPASAAPAPGAAAVPPAAPRDNAAPQSAGDAALVLVFKGTSWAEVKDASGRVILQMTGGAGMTQTVTGTPPLELALGNAPEVTVTYRGQALDLAPYVRGNVARVALR
jgi:cytoskeleton protein RodZ